MFVVARDKFIASSAVIEGVYRDLDKDLARRVGSRERDDGEESLGEDPKRIQNVEEKNEGEAELGELFGISIAEDVEAEVAVFDGSLPEAEKNGIV